MRNRHGFSLFIVFFAIAALSGRCWCASDEDLVEAVTKYRFTPEDIKNFVIERGYRSNRDAASVEVLEKAGMNKDLIDWLHNGPQPSFSSELPGPSENQKLAFTTGSGVEMRWVAPGQVRPLAARTGEFSSIIIPEGYYMAKTEVTNSQWHAVMGGDPPAVESSALPAVRVTWHGAMEFCRRLTDKDRTAGVLPAGYHYTLPSEEQWEYACRATTDGDYAGNPLELAWFLHDPQPSTVIELKPVASKKANAWGFFDMHGNASEWCARPTEEGYAIRGGAVNDGKTEIRSGKREYANVEAYFRIGFRPVAVSSKGDGAIVTVAGPQSEIADAKPTPVMAATPQPVPYPVPNGIPQSFEESSRRLAIKHGIPLDSKAYRDFADERWKDYQFEVQKAEMLNR